MKISLRIFRLSRKVLIILCGVLLLGGVAGATAVYIGKDKLLGAPEEDHSGGECTAVQEIRDQRDHQVWLRKYIKMESADGLTRVKTALRVAAAVHEKEKADLIQVVVVAENGPATRAGISGHAVGADVVYVPEPEKLASLGALPVLQASYVDALPTAAGAFYGTKMKMPEEEATHILASLPEKTDCVDPEAEAKAAAAEAEANKAEGKKGKKEKGGEGEAAAPEGEAKAGEGEAKPAAEGEAPKEGAAKPEADKGWFASIKSMVFGEEKSATEGAAKPEAAAGEAKAEAPAASAEGEAAPAEEPSQETKAPEPAASGAASEAPPPVKAGEKPAAQSHG